MEGKRGGQNKEDKRTKQDTQYHLFSDGAQDEDCGLPLSLRNPMLCSHTYLGKEDQSE